MKKLTEAQKRVLHWIGKSWPARVSHGTAVEVNGKRICNVDTMMALSRLGLATKDADGIWTATPEGKALTAELGL